MAVAFSPGGDGVRNFRRNPHTSFAAASDCEGTRFYESRPKISGRRDAADRSDIGYAHRSMSTAITLPFSSSVRRGRTGHKDSRHTPGIHKMAPQAGPPSLCRFSLRLLGRKLVHQLGPQVFAGYFPPLNG